MNDNEKLANLIESTDMKLSVAESFTGGAISASITAIPGASNYFKEGIVCYSAEAKIKRLGVSPETIKTFGAVSENTAYEMLKGLTTELGIATTGNAGPTAEKSGETGKCFIGIKVKDKLSVKEYHFSGSRHCVIEQGKTEAVRLLINALEEV